MISSNNQPKRTETSDEDFTEEHYRQLLRSAKATYHFAKYDAIPWGTRFVLWRHDLDCSINRAAALAGIEAEEGITATYFVNPCSEFYNPFEPGQTRLLKKILGLGHHLGLHFDVALHGIQDEAELHSKVAQQGRWLEEAFGVCPVVFSFHNPDAAHLQFDADSYGGLINCYSRRFKAEISYCSDSNGYWRFRRLHDVVAEASDPRLQVLTHPEWWQVKPMPPRQRIFRCAYGRAAATMRLYGETLRAPGRINHGGASAALGFLQESHPRQFELCDYLWNQSRFHILFLELWRLLEEQLGRLFETMFREKWGVPAHEVSRFFADDATGVEEWRLFDAVFGDQAWSLASGADGGVHQRWAAVHHQLAHNRFAPAPAELEEGCVYLCAIIQHLAGWGLQSELSRDGLTEEGYRQPTPDAIRREAFEKRWQTLRNLISTMRFFPVSTSIK